MRTLFEIGPDLWMAAIFALALWAPGSPGATGASDCLAIMLVEGAFILCVALVGVYLRIAFVFFPILAAGAMVWLCSAGIAGLNWGTGSFAGYLVLAFVNGVRAHRGHFGMARTHPSHPHRSYDRMLLIYLATGSVSVAGRVLGVPWAWPLWGAAYFSLLTAANTFLRRTFDSVPKALLKRMRSGDSGEVRALVGVCISCVYVQPAIPARRRRYIRCALSATDPRFAEYPATPVSACGGFSPAKQGEVVP